MRVALASPREPIRKAGVMARGGSSRLEGRLQITPLPVSLRTFAVAPTQGIGRDKHDPGPQPHFAPPSEEPRSWEAGEHLPPAYVRPEYRLSDPSIHGLPGEPFGYRYVQVRDRIYLAQLETGYVREVISAPLP